MSNELMSVPKQAIADAKARFIDTAERSGLDWKAESMFAYQLCANNDYLAKVATGNPWSLTMAMVNVSAIGITLNPARQLAYLVPRDGRVILDVSYRGLIQVAADEGAILWAKAEVVRENDHFDYRGPAQAPEHRFNPFDTDRGEIVGAYCLAQLPSGAMLVEAMPIDEIWKVRDRSMAFVKKHKGPWVDFPEEMIKKTVIKRASKTWPHTNRLATAIDYLNREAGEGLVGVEAAVATEAEDEAVEVKTEDVPEQMREYLSRIVQRAAETGLWANARELVEERYQGPYRIWATKQLQMAEDQAKTVAQA